MFVSAWVVHCNRDIFGEDADVFRPERWIDSDAEQVRAMERTMFQFGSGNYYCRKQCYSSMKRTEETKRSADTELVGKNVALFEMYKCTAALLRHFTVHFLTTADVTSRCCC